MAKVENVTVETKHEDPRKRKLIPRRDHHLVTHDDLSETLVSFGTVVAVRYPPYGNAVLPPSWKASPKATQVQVASFLGLGLVSIRRVLELGGKRVQVSPVPLPLPLEWLERYGPDSEEPYTVEDHPLPFMGTDGQRYAIDEARTVPDDLQYMP